tara:strand:- start:1822 stop:1956 length:135 start_codon:yes stop_codon:yes gene_type:complete
VLVGHLLHLLVKEMMVVTLHSELVLLLPLLEEVVAVAIVLLMDG